MAKIRLIFVALALATTLALNLTVAPRWNPIFFNDAEFTPVNQLERERSHRIWWQFSGLLFVDKLKATEILCVPEETSLYRHLSSQTDLSGITITTSCDPLDFKDVPGDKLHPDLITDRVVKDFYYAFVPGFTPESERAVVVEAHGNRLVIINTDTLDHLDVLPDWLKNK